MWFLSGFEKKALMVSSTLRAEKISISQTFICIHVFFFPVLCFASLSYYFPFNSMPFIWMPFSCIKWCLVNKGGRKAIKTDGFLINRKLPRHKGTSCSLKPLLIIQQTQLSPLFSCELCSVRTVWYQKWCFFFFFGTDFMNSFIAGDWGEI